MRLATLRWLGGPKGSGDQNEAMEKTGGRLGKVPRVCRYLASNAQLGARASPPPAVSLPRTSLLRIIRT